MPAQRPSFTGPRPRLLPAGGVKAAGGERPATDASRRAPVYSCTPASAQGDRQRPACPCPHEFFRNGWLLNSAVAVPEHLGSEGAPETDRGRPRQGVTHCRRLISEREGGARRREARIPVCSLIHNSRRGGRCRAGRGAVCATCNAHPHSLSLARLLPLPRFGVCPVLAQLNLGVQRWTHVLSVKDVLEVFARVCCASDCEVQVEMRVPSRTTYQTTHYHPHPLSTIRKLSRVNVNREPDASRRWRRRARGLAR